jgi:tetratricopeptide (TPR) repeat protein
MIYTFYSFKGGVGRSMALANIAELLYNRGLRVLMIDFDLEAPGLERYFDVKKARYMPDEVIDKRGVIDLLVSYKDLRSLALPVASSETTAKNDEDKFPYPVEPVANFIVPIYESGKNGGSLSIMSAGRRAGDEFTRYADRVRSFGWDDFYANWDGELFFEWFRKQVTASDLFDVVLIDSRTGVAEMSGVCTYQLADVVMMYVAPNYQNLDGSLKLAKSLSRAELIEKGRKGRALSLLFVPSRVEQGLGPKLDEFQKDFEASLSTRMPAKLKFEKSAFLDLMVPYTLAYAFAEDVAVREPDSSKAVYMIQAFEKMAATMAQLEPETSPLGRLYAPKDETEQQIKLAEEMYAQFTKEEQKLAKKLFVQLVRPARPDDRSEDSRAQVNMNSLDEPTQQIARKLSNAKLVVIERDTLSVEQVQVAQESLIRKWQRLRKWVDEDLTFLQWRQGLQGNMTDWEKNKKDKTALLYGSRLDTAKDWQDRRGDDLTDSEKSYIDLSLRKRLKARIVNVTSLALLALIIVILAGQESRRQARELEITNQAQAIEFNGKGLEALRNDADAAIELFGKAIEFNKNFREAYDNRANAYAGKGDYDSAIADFEQVIKLQPNSPDAHYNLGVALQKKGDLNQALLNFNQAIQEKSDYTEAYKARASLYLSQGKPDAAVDDFNQAIQLDANDAESYGKRALAFMQINKYEQALADYNRALDLKPDYAEAYLNSGLIYKRLGIKDSAIANLQFAVKYTSNNEIATQASQTLLELGQKPPEKVQVRVYIEYLNPDDKKIVNSIAALLSKRGYKVTPQLTEGRTSGDVRYSYQEDKQAADDIRGVVKDALSDNGLKLNIASLFVRSRTVTPGHIEVWLPPLRGGVTEPTPVPVEQSSGQKPPVKKP